MFKIWLQAARPKTLIAGISPVLIGMSLALAQGHFNLLTLLFTLLTSLGIQIGTNFANDYCDFVKGADTATRKGPLRVTQAGLVSQVAIKRATTGVFACTALFGSYLVWEGGFVIAVLLGLAILLGILYTAGPYPLGYVGLGDLCVFLFFGPIAVASTYYLQTHTLSYGAIIAGIAPGALSSAILIVNNLRDIEEDRLAQKKTLAVRFGSQFGKLEYLFAILLTLCSSLVLSREHPFCLLSALILIPGAALIRAVFTNDNVYAFNGLLQRTAQLLLLYTLLFCIGCLL